jgi:hypothetical protein
MAPRRQQGMHARLASGVGRHFDPGQLALTGFRRRSVSDPARGVDRTVRKETAPGGRPMR